MFLLENFSFNGTEVHEIAEQLEHINPKSSSITPRYLLGLSYRSPHSDPIRTKTGTLKATDKTIWPPWKISNKRICVGVKDSDDEFLKYLNKEKHRHWLNGYLLAKEDFDHSSTSASGRSFVLHYKGHSENLFVKSHESEVIYTKLIAFCSLAYSYIYFSGLWTVGIGLSKQSKLEQKSGHRRPFKSNSTPLRMRAHSSPETT